MTPIFTFIITLLASGLCNGASISNGLTKEDRFPPVECPESTDGFSVFIPHPFDCSKYYHCKGDVPILQECPANLHFDTSINVCNYPEVAGCTPSTTESSPVATSDDSESTEEPLTTNSITNSTTEVSRNTTTPSSETTEAITTTSMTTISTE